MDLPPPPPPDKAPHTGLDFYEFFGMTIALPVAKVSPVLFNPPPQAAL